MAPFKIKTDPPVEPPDSHRLNAAQGWLELGNAAEAALELAGISPSIEAHPDVLELKWEIQAKQHQWETACGLAFELIRSAPHRCSGWIQRSFALHELKKTAEAYELLLPAVKRFKTVHTVPYNLACYCCQLNRMEEARKWIGAAIEIAGLEVIRGMAANDPDLAAMRHEILQWKPA